MKIQTEDQYINEMVSILKEKLSKDYEPGNTKRDAHPKCLGLLKAHFVVSSNLPPNLKVGLFSKPGTYPALIRSSCSSPTIKGDDVKDARGFSIKLLNVPGEKFYKDEKSTQDFVLLSGETMPLGTVKLFYEALYYNTQVNPLVYLLKTTASGNLPKLLELNKLRQHQTSPLDIPYYSTTPYYFGDTYVKYAVLPTSSYVSTLPKKLTSTYLTDNMKTHLNKNVATFDFLVQLRKNNMPIDDASVKWDESESPFIKVAEIIIDKQNIDTQDRWTLAENLSFSPAHSLLEHKPAGGLNKARSVIYKEMSLFRHERNNISLIEPTLSDFNKLK